MAKRRTLQETRGVLLDAGRELVEEFDLERGESTAGALAHIRAADVAARAGLSKGMVYHLWDDQDAYRRDLLIHLSRQLTGVPLAAVPIPSGSASDPKTFFRDAGNASFDSLMEDSSWRLFVELCSYMNDPEVQEPLHEAWTNSAIPAAKAMEQALDDLGRRIIEPLTVDHLVHVTRAIGRGFRLLAGIDPQAYCEKGFEWEGSEGWSLYAIAIHTAVCGLTEEVS